MPSAPFCAADENEIVFIKARVVGNYGDDLQVEFIAGAQVTKVFVGAGDVLTAPSDPIADAVLNDRIATLRRTHLRY